MARQVRFEQLGGPEVLHLEEVTLPAPAPGECHIAVSAIGLNRAELGFRQGRYIDVPQTFPAGLGYEAAGRVLRTGDASGDFVEGQAVSVLPTFSMNDYATYGDEALVPVQALVARDPDSDPITHAAAWMQYLTAYGALADIGGTGAGDTVVVTAAASSVGLAAIQIARLRGARALAVLRPTDLQDPVLAAGADAVIVQGADEIAASVLDHTDGRGAELVFDAVAGPGVRELARATATGGTIIIHGTLSGQPTPFPGTDTMRALSVRSYTLFEITRDPARLAVARGDISAGLADGTLKPLIDRIFPLDDIVEAHRYMESGQARAGKVVAVVQ
ncbi:zinc-dependent alcohol dehydrogenase family protein [Kineosporia mesophila]|uniref:Zinc-dependent alcohol dehydrogenase family protein n=1 Tax=Kineosporia mesophila TaxID=566012 RepID=A0ABP6ZI98_9ACTN|nr:zinc-dependent alcohol dehydrogenase family protein [Kineosporia mesophila]MCD5349741.1 zinc-dependent alcohol dehydrogenase family protein [Kineosporia mesophila]